MGGNLVFREGDVWSVYRLGPTTRAQFDTSGPAAAHLSIRALSQTLRTDFTLLRVARPWSVDDYAIGFEAVADIRHARRPVLEAYVRAQRAALEALGSYSFDTFLSVHLPIAAQSTPAARWSKALCAAEAKVLNQIQRCVSAARARREDVLWLTYRAFRRGLPEIGHAPYATKDGADAYTILDVAAAGNVVVNEGTDTLAEPQRWLRIASESGISHQSFLLVEALPATARVGSDCVDLLSGLETVDFPVDAAVTTVVDPGARSPDLAHPDIGTRPPRTIGQDSGTVEISSLSLAVSAGSAAELERRVIGLRRELSGTRLRRTAVDQRQLFDHHLPCPPSTEPTARLGLPMKKLDRFSLQAARLGSYAGPYLGHTVSGPPRPVLFDPFEAARVGVLGSTLVTGARGSGKTLCLELIMYQALLSGASVIDVDVHGDHALERLPDVAAHATVLELSAPTRFRGLLDPLRIAPTELREALACDLLTSLLPETSPANWQDEVSRAVGIVASRRDSCCDDVLARLDAGCPQAREAARELRAAARSGLAALGFGHQRVATHAPAGGQLTVLRLREVHRKRRPQSSPRASTRERLGHVITQLIVSYALGLAAAVGHGHGHCLLSVDDASALLFDPRGQALMGHLAAGGPGGTHAPLVAIPAVHPSFPLAERFGTALWFRVENDRQAASVARLIRPGKNCTGLTRSLVDARPGRCVMRDHRGRVDAVQIEFVDDRLLPVLDTTPRC
jgi:hypothetical protein